jgi:hypothetical protein
MMPAEASRGPENRGAFDQKELLNGILKTSQV